jgi:penicillin amidase
MKRERLLRVPPAGKLLIGRLPMTRHRSLLSARALIALLPATPVSGAAPAAALLRGWDCDVTADSTAAALYELVLSVLLEDFRKQVVPPAARELLASATLPEMLGLLAGPDPRLRDRLINQALAEGWNQAVELLGSDPAAWRRSALRHRMAVAA